MPKAFIFDLDGVIVDTAEFHYLAWKQLASDLGITIDRPFNEQLKGVSRMDSLERILTLNPSYKDMSKEEKHLLAQKKNANYQEMLHTITPKNILPGINDLLEAITQHSIKIALGSASKNAPFVISQLQLDNYFDYVVDAGEIINGKPDPETFLKAADFFKSHPSECIGIEDAEAGIEAINRANMFSVGVGTNEQMKQASYVVSSTSQLDFDSIIKQYNYYILRKNGK